MRGGAAGAWSIATGATPKAQVLHFSSSRVKGEGQCSARNHTHTYSHDDDDYAASAKKIIGEQPLLSGLK